MTVAVPRRRASNVTVTVMQRRRGRRKPCLAGATASESQLDGSEFGRAARHRDRRSCWPPGRAAGAAARAVTDHDWALGRPVPGRPARTEGPTVSDESDEPAGPAAADGPARRSDSVRRLQPGPGPGLPPRPGPGLRLAMAIISDGQARLGGGQS